MEAVCLSTTYPSAIERAHHPHIIPRPVTIPHSAKRQYVLNYRTTVSYNASWYYLKLIEELGLLRRRRQERSRVSVQSMSSLIKPNLPYIRKIELMLPEAPVMLNLYSVRRFGFFRHLFPDRIDVRTIEITCAVPAPTPYYIESASGADRRRTAHTIMWTGLEVDRLGLLLRKQTVVGAKP
jgi:hypothetical protein